MSFKRRGSKNFNFPKTSTAEIELNKKKALRRTASASEPAQPSGEENVLKVIVEREKNGGL